MCGLVFDFSSENDFMSAINCCCEANGTHKHVLDFDHETGTVTIKANFSFKLVAFQGKN